MAILDARKADLLFNMTDGAMVRFQSYQSSSATQYAWNTFGGDRIYADGTGIATSGANRPTSASIATSLRFDLDRDGAYPNTDIDVLVRNVSVPIATLLVSDVAFWNTVLKGHDTIYAPQTVAARVFGDQFDVRFRNVLGGNDAIKGGTGEGQTLVGDTFTVNGLNGGSTPTTFRGGHDTIVAYNTIGTSTLVGDVDFGLQATIFGGNDKLTGSDTRGDVIVGDFNIVRAATVTAAVDYIYGRGGDDFIYGDFRSLEERFYEGNQAVAAADLIDAGDGNDTVFGDVDNIDWYELGLDTGQRLQAGNDRIFGGNGADTIYGDSRYGLVFAGNSDINRTDYGNDRIWGGDDNDTIYGDSTRNQDTYGGHDILWGENGADMLAGNIGNDRIYGGADNDRLHGGRGDDQLYGESGADTFVFVNDATAGSTDGVDQVFDFVNNIDTLEIGRHYGFATAQAVINAATVSGSDVTLNLSATDKVILVGFGIDKSLLLDDIVLI